MCIRDRRNPKQSTEYDYAYLTHRIGEGVVAAEGGVLVVERSGDLRLFEIVLVRTADAVSYTHLSAERAVDVLHLVEVLDVDRIGAFASADVALGARRCV